MLTIKVQTNNGFDFIEETPYVQLIHDAEDTFISYESLRQEFFKEIREGDIYVMNESGKTIADYHLPQKTRIEKFSV